VEVPTRPPKHAGGRIHEHRPLDLREVAVLVEHVPRGTHAHEGAQGVEKAHEEQREEHGEHLETQDAGDVELQGHRPEIVGRPEGHGRDRVWRLAQAQEQPRARRDRHGQEDRSAYTVIQEHGDQQESADRQQDTAVGQIADLEGSRGRQQRARLRHGERLRGQAGHEAGHDARLVEPDEGEEQADAGREAVLEAGRDRRGQPGADAQQRDDGEQHAGQEDGAQALLPGDAERGQAESQERVLAHVGRYRDGPIRIEAHEEAAEGGGQDRGHGARARGEAREGQDGRVHHDDVGHGEEGGQASHHLHARRGPALAQME
jgi:hypothetical protein